MKKLIFLIASIFIFSTDSYSFTYEYKNKPLRVGVNENEILVKFEGPIRFFGQELLNQEDVSKHLMITNTNNGLLIKANKAFPEMRVKLARKDIKQVYLIDFYHSNEVKDIVIKDYENPSDKEAFAETAGAISDCNFIGCVSDVRARLLRHGFQKYYAPARLIDPLPGSFISTKKDKVLLNKSFSSLTLETILFGGYRLIVVEVGNKTKLKTTIDPRDIYHEKINMISAYSWRLEPKGSNGDKTLMFIVTEV